MATRRAGVPVVEWSRWGSLGAEVGGARRRQRADGLIDVLVRADHLYRCRRSSAPPAPT